MELWFSDYQTEKVKVSVKVQKQLFGLQTEFQRIDVFDSDEFGRFLSADGSIVFSEKDEFIYDEMIVHVPMAVHPCVKNVLVIGGGDGGVARELTLDTLTDREARTLITIPKIEPTPREFPRQFGQIRKRPL